MFRSQVQLAGRRSGLQQRLGCLIGDLLLRAIREKVETLRGIGEIRLDQLLVGTRRWQIPELDLVILVLLLREVRSWWGIREIRLDQLLVGTRRWQIPEFDLVILVLLLREVRAWWGIREIRLDQLLVDAGSF